MGALRTKRALRDRECGLIFSWRLPVGDHFRLGAAILTVALLATGLAASVRVRIDEGARPIERRASMVVIPSAPEWRALEMRALESGPFPSRTDLARDPGEQRNQIAEEPVSPEVARRIAARVNDWRLQKLELGREAERPLDPELLDRLKGLGYVD